ncbi:MAG: transcriptional regulator [Gammaproteobacteria bacterium]|nr:MAG: transcriptional regulator [Gammaproteobacteria bacterium]
MINEHKVRIGIMPQEKIRERMLLIARGSYKPKADDPKIWFTSMRSLAEVLSDENRALLHVIKETEPNSIKELSEATGRKPGNLSRTLKTLSSYGIVELIKDSKQVKPVVKAVEFEILAA